MDLSTEELPVGDPMMKIEASEIAHRANGNGEGTKHCQGESLDNSVIRILPRARSAVTRREAFLGAILLCYFGTYGLRAHAPRGDVRVNGWMLKPGDI